MPIDDDHLDKALEAIQKTYPNSIGLDYDRNPPRISTGSYELDRATGGGIPIGRFSRIWGGYSSGKSLTCWNVAREAQRQGLGPVVYYNIEKQYHPDFVESLGVSTDPKDLIVVEGSMIEEVGTAFEALLGGARVHILDSLSSAISIDEMNTALENHPPMALKARAWGRVLQKALARLQPENAVIMIDQARDTIGYGGGEHPPGGRFIEFTSSLTIHYRRGKWLFYDDDGFLDPDGKNDKTLSGQTEANGTIIHAKVTKTRVCKPGRTASMYLDYGKINFDHISELEKAARHFKVVEGSKWWTLPDGSKVQGRKGLRKALESNQELQDQVIARIKEDY